ncbi:hypothetical protein EJB05_14265, partial [Eragrostis curvula]
MALPDLIDDAIAEILLRLPPDEPAYLVRVGLVCKAWRRILSDLGFPLRYRDFHRTPPMLGFLHNTYDRSRGYGAISRFVPTTAAKPFLDGNHWTVADCRHGRVLVEHPRTEEYVVWDPITGDREELLNRPVFRPETHTAAAVLCAVAGCDHRNCHGRPFKAIFLSAVNHQLVVHACVYSSRDPAWSMPVSANIPRGAGAGFDTSRGVFIGDVYYHNLGCGKDTLVTRIRNVVAMGQAYQTEFAAVVVSCMGRNIRNVVAIDIIPVAAAGILQCVMLLALFGAV